MKHLIASTLVMLALAVGGGGTETQHRRDPRRRHGLQRHRLLRQRNPHAQPRQARGGRIAVHAVLQHGPLLPHPGLAAHGPVPAPGGRRAHDRGPAARPATGADLNDRCVTIAEVLRSAGYFTAMSRQVARGEIRRRRRRGSTKLNWPLPRGFDHYFGIIQGGRITVHLKPLTLENDDSCRPRGLVHDRPSWTDYGIKFIDEARTARSRSSCTWHTTPRIFR